MAAVGDSSKTYKICSIDRMAIGLYALAISEIKPNANIYLVLTGGGKGNQAKIGLYPKTDKSPKVDKTIVETRCPNPPFIGDSNIGENIFPIDAGPEAQGVKGKIKSGVIEDDSLLRDALTYYQLMFNAMNGTGGRISEELIEAVKNTNSPLLMQWVVLLAVYDTYGCFEPGKAIKYLNNFRRESKNKVITEHDVEIYNLFRNINDSLLKGTSLINGRDMINYLMSKTFGDYGTIYAFLRDEFSIEDGNILRHMKKVRPFLIRDIAHDQHDTLKDVDLLGGRRERGQEIDRIYSYRRPEIKKGKHTVTKDESRAKATDSLIKRVETERRRRLQKLRQITGLVKSSFIVSEPEDDTHMASDEQSVISTASTSQTVVPEDDQFEAYMDEIYGQISFLDKLNEKEGFSDWYYDTLDMLKINLLSSYLVVSGATRIIVNELQVCKTKDDCIRMLQHIYRGYESSNVEPLSSYGEAYSAGSKAMEGEGSGRKNARRIRLSKRKSRKKTRKSKKKTRKSKKKTRKD